MKTVRFIPLFRVTIVLLFSILLSSCFQKDQESIAPKEDAPLAELRAPEKDQTELFTIPLIKAAAKGEGQTVAQLLKEGVSIDVQDPKVDEMTALMVAAHKGHIDIVKQLLDAGAQVNLPNRFGTTPLMFAVDGGHREIVEELVKRGANVSMQEIEKWDKNQGRSALMFAIMRNHPSIVAFLLQKTPQKLINHIYRIGDDYLTPLMYAASHGYTEIVDLLLNAGADINMQSPKRDDQTALYLAALGWASVPAFEGPSYKKIDKKPIKNTVELLLNKGATIDSRTKGGNTILHAAACYGNKEVVELLLHALEKKQIPLKDFINIQNNKGETALMYPLIFDWRRLPCFSPEHKEVVALLTEKGADPSIQDKAGKTAFDYIDAGLKELEQLKTETSDAQELQKINALSKAYKTIKSMLTKGK